MRWVAAPCSASQLAPPMTVLMCGARRLTYLTAASAAVFCWKVEVKPTTSGPAATIRSAISCTNSGTTRCSSLDIRSRSSRSLPRIETLNSGTRHSGSSYRAEENTQSPHPMKYEESA